MHAYPANAPPLTPSGCVMGRAGPEEEEDPALLEDLLGLWFFILPPPCKPRSPWTIKGGVGHPANERDRLSMNNPHTEELIEHLVPHTLPSYRQALGILSTPPSETEDPSLSRLFVPPTMNRF